MDYFLLRPNLNVLCCDIIALDFLIEAFPDTSICMGKLLDTSSDSSGFSVDDKEEIRLFQQLKEMRSYNLSDSNRSDSD